MHRIVTTTCTEAGTGRSRRRSRSGRDSRHRGTGLGRWCWMTKRQGTALETKVNRTNVSSPVRNGDDNVQRRRSPTNRSLPCLRPPTANEIVDRSEHKNEDALFLAGGEDKTIEEEM